MSVIDDLVARYKPGTPVDTDGFPKEQPFQCFDLALVYARLVTGNAGLYIRCKTSGYVKDWWNDFGSTGLSEWFEQVPWNAKGQRGDIVIWGNAPQTPYSHIAILLEDKGSVQNILGQNQPSPYCTVRDFTSVGILGYLRPKGQGDDDMITKDDTALVRIVNTEVKGYPFNETHAGNYDANEMAFWTGRSWREFVMGGWTQAVGWREKRNAAIPFYDQYSPEIDTLVQSKANVLTLTQQLTDSQRDQSTAVAARTIAESQVTSLQTTIDELKKQVPPPITGDGGTLPTPLVDFPSLLRRFLDWLKYKFTKKG